jgi:hypothetical protein
MDVCVAKKRCKVVFSQIAHPSVKKTNTPIYVRAALICPISHNMLENSIPEAYLSLTFCECPRIRSTPFAE